MITIKTNEYTIEILIIDYSEKQFLNKTHSCIGNVKRWIENLRMWQKETYLVEVKTEWLGAMPKL